MKRLIYANASYLQYPTTTEGWVDWFQDNLFKEYRDYEGLDDLRDFIETGDSETDKL